MWETNQLMVANKSEWACKVLLLSICSNLFVFDSVLCITTHENVTDRLCYDSAKVLRQV